jgi:hypothetical protein
MKTGIYEHFLFLPVRMRVGTNHFMCPGKLKDLDPQTQSEEPKTKL